MNHYRWVIGFAFLGLILALVVAGSVWFSPFGTGESEDSPDGRYHTSAMNMRQGTWLNGRINFVDIKVIENSSGRIVWHAKRYPLASEASPDFGNRSKKHIQWAADSRSVSVPVGGLVDSVWSVP